MGHFCPVCLRSVNNTDAERRIHRETCHTGEMEVSLLHCPACGVVLAAEVEAPRISVTPMAA